MFLFFSRSEDCLSLLCTGNPSYARDSLELMTYLLFLSSAKLCSIMHDRSKEWGHFLLCCSKRRGQSVNHVVKCTKYSRELHFGLFMETTKDLLKGGEC